MNVLLFVLSLCVLSCGTRAPVAVAPPKPVAPMRVELLGRIWDVAAKRFVSRAELEAKLVKAELVLLGEKHDNPEHHELQAAMLKAVVNAGRRPVVAFEMIDIDRQAAVDDARAAHPGDASSIAEAALWEKSGWPPFAQYRQIFDVALAADLPVVAANLARASVRALVRGTDGARETIVARLDLAAPLPEPLAESLRQEMRDAHCGKLPEAMVEPMVLAQRARDAEMAERMLLSKGGQGAVLIAGSGHTRTDRGVPREILRRRADETIVSLSFVEVDPAKPDPDGYGERWGVARPPFDYLWFTTRANDDDPCAQFHAPKSR